MIVVLAEKPSVARDIARILGATQRGEGCLKGNGYVVTWAFGHLVELQEPESYDPALKSWNLKQLPILPEPFKLRVAAGKGIKEQFAIIKKQFKAADSLICATDAGREGELIFRYIQELSGCKGKPAQRLWISSLTDTAIHDGFRQLKPLADYDNLAAAALCRSQADWIVGLNATRGYTVQHSHGRGVLSVGRVQTPVLALIVERDQNIRDFKPENYWELWTRYREVDFKHRLDRFKTEPETQALLLKVQESPFRIVKVEEKAASQAPPQLFDLTELQRALNKLKGFASAKTLQLAQSLYEKKLISYPRTDSRYLSDDLYSQCGPTLEKLRGRFAQEIAPLDLSRLSKSKRVFNTAKVTDHHGIIPTGQCPGQLSADEQVVYQVLCLRFIAAFYPNCEKSHTTVHGQAAGETFKAKGTRIVVPGWMALYPSLQQNKDQDEQTLPAFHLDEEGPHTPKVKKCQTKPPKHYTEATLLTAMETAGKTVDDDELKEAMKDGGLGTPATRASIIETLLKREYITREKKTLLATPKAQELIRLLQKQTLTSAKLTGEWELRLKQIERGAFSPTEFMAGVRKFTTDLVAALQRESEPDPSNLGPCPYCSQPVIRGKTGYGCSAWKTGCPFRFHAQQFGTVLQDKDVQTLLRRGRLAHPRKLTDTQGNACQGYVTLDNTGQVGVLTREAKIHDESLGNCPFCSSAVLEKHKCYACLDCDFVIWKKIARRAVSKSLVKVLLSKGKSQVLKGFRSKAGKPFSAALLLKDGKVAFDFGQV